MTKLPAAMFVVDIKKEELVVKEAAKLGIPVIAMIDSNVDPELVTYRIPANDDAIRSVKLFATVIANAALEGQGGFEGQTIVETGQLAEDFLSQEEQIVQEEEVVEAE